MLKEKIFTVIDSGSSGVFKLDMLDDNNFHIWKVRIDQLLYYRELDDYLHDEPPGDREERKNGTGMTIKPNA